MPELSRFFGIVIRMFAEDEVQHHLPHFHAFYNEFSATYSIRPLELLAGSLPQRQQRMTEGWAELHQNDLLEAWETLTNGRRVSKIRPLE